MENKKLKSFVLIYDNGCKDITNHYNINVVKETYLNKQVRASNGSLQVCVGVLNN